MRRAEKIYHGSTGQSLDELQLFCKNEVHRDTTRGRRERRFGAGGLANTGSTA